MTTPTPNEPKTSLWKKPWRGWRGVLAWFLILTFAAFAAIFLIGLIAGSFNTGAGATTSEWAASSFVIALVLGTVGLLAFLFVRWICCWRHFRWFLIGVACLITLIALFYVEEDVRGKSAWNRFKSEEEAKGEKF